MNCENAKKYCNGLIIMDIVPLEDGEGEYTDEFRMSLLRGLSDIKHGKVRTLEEVINSYKRSG